jgi:hypothetical protein
LGRGVHRHPALGSVKPRHTPPIINSMFVSAAVLVAVLVLAAGLDVRT